jgi:hypothetical protein
MMQDEKTHAGPAKGARGSIELSTSYDDESTRLTRSIQLAASEDGKTLRLIDVDERRLGIQRAFRFEIAVDELVALVRANGAELPGESVD